MTRFASLKDEFSFMRGNVLVLAVTLIIVNFMSAIPFTFYAKYVEELGGTPFIVGIIGFASFVILALVQFPGGYLADKRGRRWLTVAMTFGVAVTYCFYAVSPSWHFIFVAAVLQNLCFIYQPALVALMADSIPTERLGIGFSIFTIAFYISAPSPIIAGILSVQYGLVSGMRIAYLMVAVSLVAVALMRTEVLRFLVIKLFLPFRIIWAYS